MLGYILIFIATVLFALQFVFTKKYQEQAGASLEATFLSSLISPILYVIIMLVINFVQTGYLLSATPFSLVLALLLAFVFIASSYFGIKALSWGSMTNYSMWLMAGSMILPIIYGTIFNGDKLSVWAIIGCLIVLAAIIIKMDFKEKSTKKTLFGFIMLGFLNGLVSVIQSLHTTNVFNLEVVSANEFNIWRCLFGMIIGGIFLIIIFFKDKNKHSNKSINECEPLSENVCADIDDKLTINKVKKSIPWALCVGVINGIATLLLLISLTMIIPSVQYPFLTGGTIFISAIFAFLRKEKIGKKGWLAVVIAFIGTVFVAL